MKMSLMFLNLPDRDPVYMYCNSDVSASGVDSSSCTHGMVCDDSVNPIVNIALK